MRTRPRHGPTRNRRGPVRSRGPTGDRLTIDERPDTSPRRSRGNPRYPVACIQAAEMNSLVRLIACRWQSWIETYTCSASGLPCMTVREGHWAASSRRPRRPGTTRARAEGRWRPQLSADRIGQVLSGSGSVTRMSAPPLGPSATETVPWWAWTVCATTAKPGSTVDLAVEVGGRRREAGGDLVGVRACRCRRPAGFSEVLVVGVWWLFSSGAGSR